jgi:beta-lactam-binding protein with PASTA domain
LAVSLGPQKAAIPALEGMNESLAGITIQRAGLQLGDVFSIADAYAPEDTVVAQTPQANATDVPGPKVGLLIAQPLVQQPEASVMADLVGEPFTTAAFTILHDGFKLAPVENPVATAPAAPSSLPSGTVVAQVPIAGSRIVAGTTIYLTVQP